MTIGRRQILGAGAALGAAISTSTVPVAAATGPQGDVTAGKGAAKKLASRLGGMGLAAHDFGISPNSGQTETPRLQAAVDAAALAKLPLLLPPGSYLTGPLILRPGSRLHGIAGASVIAFTPGESCLTGTDAAGIRIEGITFDAAMGAPGGSGAVLALRDCLGLTLSAVTVQRCALNGIHLERSSGRITECTISQIGGAGLHSIDATGLEITSNQVTDCANNGILVWRSSPGEDGSIVSNNRITRIRSKAGGSGQNGNGINVYRAGNVLVSGNRISDCAYTAVRGNNASNIQIIGNSCSRLGEVALYAEFAFEGALIANNIVEEAATGIAVTNFNKGGRLAVIQGNIIRNLRRREQEPVDKRGNGIGVEADAVVSGNVIENAPSAGIVIGWGGYMRNVNASNNLIRNARRGIIVTADPEAGACVIAQNIISGAGDGGVRLATHDVAQGPDLAGAQSSVAGANGNIHLMGNVSG